MCLVDIDGQALKRGTTFQKVHDSPRVRQVESVDLTGLADRLLTWQNIKPTDPEVIECTRLAEVPPAALASRIGGPFDVVLSPCVLSQLLTPLRDTLGEEHRGFIPLLNAIRARHFRLMLDLLSPGGRGVFASDLFSSATVNDLARVPTEKLPDLMRQRVAAGRIFSGLDPASIAGVLTRDGMIAPRIRQYHLIRPWLWHLGLSKTYLVHAITFTSKA